MRFCIFLALLVTIWAAAPRANHLLGQAEPQTSADSQPPPVNWRGERILLERDFENELREIADWCRSQGIEQQVKPTLKLYENRDAGRQYIYLPSERSMSVAGDNLIGQWIAKINAAKKKHANRIFELSKQASGQGAGAVAFQLLHEVIHFDLDHVEVRKILGHKKSEDGWRVASDSVRVKPANKPHDLINWPAGSYIRVLTPHFEIESNASEEKTRYLAEQLERAHQVWRQVFFEYWSSSAAVERWIKGKGKARIANKRFRVLFFADRQSYLQKLTPLVRGIEVSTGYYSSDEGASFFYDGDARVQDTWRHELTHQLFRESGRANKQAFEEQFIWLDEGIATYFESLTDFGDHVTLGGFEARRMQYARIRRMLEHFHLPLNKLSAIGRKNLQQHADIVRIYSESAGLTDMLMNDENGLYESRLTEFLKLIYKGRVKQGAFEKIIGKTYEQLDMRYQEYLQVNSAQVEKYLTQPELRTELSVAGANLTSAAYDSIGRCVNLEWIDLSRNAITAKHFVKLKDCQQLNQIILTQCRFENDSLRGLELFSQLDDVDLSGSSVQDFQLAGFKNIRGLKSLGLASTTITDKGLLQLANVTGLVSLDVSRTSVTNEGIAKLKSRLPNLQVTK